MRSPREFIESAQVMGARLFYTATPHSFGMEWTNEKGERVAGSYTTLIAEDFPFYEALQATLYEDTLASPSDFASCTQVRT